MEEKDNLPMEKKKALYRPLQIQCLEQFHGLKFRVRDQKFWASYESKLSVLNKELLHLDNSRLMSGCS
jgi:hypothetical protein